jgi:hypothetical protein
VVVMVDVVYEVVDEESVAEEENEPDPVTVGM